MRKILIVCLSKQQLRPKIKSITVYKLRRTFRFLLIADLSTKNVFIQGNIYNGEEAIKSNISYLEKFYEKQKFKIEKFSWTEKRLCTASIKKDPAPLRL